MRIVFEEMSSWSPLTVYLGMKTTGAGKSSYVISFLGDVVLVTLTMYLGMKTTGAGKSSACAEAYIASRNSSIKLKSHIADRRPLKLFREQFIVLLYTISDKPFKKKKIDYRQKINMI